MTILRILIHALFYAALGLNFDFLPHEDGSVSPAKSDEIAVDDSWAILAPQALYQTPNGFSDALSLLKGRSPVFDQMEKRQSCDEDYGYCADFGGCCPADNRCCSYNYCLEPGKTCCPSGPCPSGSLCCGDSNCVPDGNECCSDGSNCEAGNICVQIISTGRIVCCTDLRCTAYVTGGSTVYQSSSRYTPTSVVPPVTTRPPTTTQIQYEYYYAVFTYYYIAYFYTIIQQVSSVTYTERTTYTTVSVTATDEFDASSLLEELSDRFSFSTPSDASTELEPLLTAVPSEPTEGPTFNIGTGQPTSSTSRTSAVVTAGDGPTDASPPGGVGQASHMRGGSFGVAWLCALMVTPGFFMLVL